MGQTTPFTKSPRAPWMLSNINPLPFTLSKFAPIPPSICFQICTQNNRGSELSPRSVYAKFQIHWSSCFLYYSQTSFSSISLLWPWPWFKVMERSAKNVFLALSDHILSMKFVSQSTLARIIFMCLELNSRSRSKSKVKVIKNIFLDSSFHLDSLYQTGIIYTYIDVILVLDIKRCRNSPPAPPPNFFRICPKNNRGPELPPRSVYTKFQVHWLNRSLYFV